MIRHSYIVIVLIGFLVVACSQEQLVERASQPAQAVEFNTYVSAPMTRSGGEVNRHAIDETELKKADCGFGVFAYYTDGVTFEEAGEGQIQDFMYNQQVTWDATLNNNAGGWTYSPKKYWPNEDGTQSEGTDYLSFFAYAPYDANISIGEEKDPYVEYTLADDPADVYDLMWATAPTSESYTGKIKGLPNLNMTRQQVSEKVQLHFKHALARLQLMVVADYGNLNVRPDLAGDLTKLEAADTLELLNNTRITVESATLTAKDAYKKARLNLNNTTAGRPKWTLVEGEGNEADMTYNIDGTVITPSILDPGDSYADMFGATPDVTGVPRLKPGYEMSPSLCATDLVNSEIPEHYYYFIPKERPQQIFEITVVYWTTVKDANLIKGDTPGFSRIKHTVTQTLKLNGRNGQPLFEGNKHFYVVLALGIEGVQFSVASVNWDGRETITTQ